MILGFSEGMIVNKKRIPTNFVSKIKQGIKIHTIRNGSRWASGKKIHFATGIRSTRYNCFKTGVCTSTQPVRIVNRQVIIHETVLSSEEVETFSKNDGFDNVDQFWAWFDKNPVTNGQIVHWTDLKY